MNVVETLKVVEPVSIDTVVFDADLKFRLKRCDYCQSVFWGTFPFKTWNKCVLNGEHCPFNGKRLRFRVNHVVWECPSIVSKVGGGV